MPVKSHKGTTYNINYQRNERPHSTLSKHPIMKNEEKISMFYYLNTNFAVSNMIMNRQSLLFNYSLFDKSCIGLCNVMHKIIKRIKIIIIKRHAHSTLIERFRNC